MIGPAILGLALRIAAVLGVLGFGVCAFFKDRDLMLAYGLGWALSLANLYALGRIGRLFESGSVKRAAIFWALKFAVLVGAIACALFLLRSSVVGLLSGFSVSVMAILLASLWPQKVAEGEHHG